MAERSAKLYEEIVAQLLDRIQSGQLRLGDRLPPERALAEEMGVSRTAIREALRSMEMMGCVESRVGEGTFIRKPTIEDLVDPFSVLFAENRHVGGELLEVRLILETEVCALAARRRSDAALAALKQTLKAMEADIAAGGIGVKADDDFHEILIDAAGNESLSAILHMCSSLLSRTRPLTQALRGVPKRTLIDHTAICDAIERQDEGAARRLMREHLKRAARNLQRVRRPGGGGSE